jgi:hypothetical protein
MGSEEQFRNLIRKWTADSRGLRDEARRLELSDFSRHATSMVMLEARAQAIDRCIIDVQILQRTGV